jgi:hypothetical protein
VIKLTKPGLYGDLYYLHNGLVNQRNCSISEYAVRTHLSDFLGFHTSLLGITDTHQIVTSQKFIQGTQPTNTEVSEFLRHSDFTPVKEECWLWQRLINDLLIWVGDARTDNFVKTEHGIVPIDLRMWVTIAE